MGDYIVTFDKEPTVTETQLEQIEGFLDSAAIAENYRDDPKEWAVSTEEELTAKRMEAAFKEFDVKGVKVVSVEKNPY